MNYTARDIRRAIVHDAMEAGLAGSGVPVPRDYLAERIREYRAAGVSNGELVGALVVLQCCYGDAAKK